MSRGFTRDNRASVGAAIRNKVPGREGTWVKKCMERWQMTEERISKTATLRRSLCVLCGVCRSFSTSLGAGLTQKEHKSMDPHLSFEKLHVT